MVSIGYGHQLFFNHAPGCYKTKTEQGDLDCDEEHDHDGGPEEQVGENDAEDCGWDWECDKQHYKTKTESVRAQYKDWQDTVVKDKRVPFFSDRDDPYDPIYAYIAVVTDDDE